MVLTGMCVTTTYLACTYKVNKTEVIKHKYNIINFQGHGRVSIRYSLKKSFI